MQTNMRSHFFFPPIHYSYHFSFSRLLYALALEIMDKVDARCYRLAKEAMPYLVATETPLLAFLRTDDYDPQKAAQRLANYWTYRRELFGERWLLPMTQTGTGALSLQDIALLKTGIFLSATVPSIGIVAFADFSKADTFFRNLGHSLDVLDLIPKISMYIGTVMTDERMQTEGFTLFHIVTSASRKAVECRSDMWDSFRKAFPMKIRTPMLAQGYDPAKQVLSDYIRFHTAKVVEFNTKMPPNEIVGNSVGSTLKLLEENGFPRTAVPMQLGGALDYDREVAEWTRMRLSLEDAMSASPPSLNVIPHELFAHRTGAKRQRIASNRDISSVPSSSSLLSVTDTESNRRERGALYARRSYHRRKLDLLSLHDQVNVLNERNRVAREEFQRLQHLIIQAYLIVNSATASSVASSTTVPPTVFQSAFAPLPDHAPQPQSVTQHGSSFSPYSWGQPITDNSNSATSNATTTVDGLLCFPSSLAFASVVGGNTDAPIAAAMALAATTFNGNAAAARGSATSAYATSAYATSTNTTSDDPAAPSDTDNQDMDFEPTPFFDGF